MIHKRIPSFIKQYPYRSGLIVILIIGIGVWAFSGDKDVAPAAAEMQPRSVTLTTLEALRADAAPLAISGTVFATAEAQLRAESSGRVTAVLVTLGQDVAQGTTIATIENARERAALTQAQGAYDAAVASQGGISTDQARDAALTAYRDAFNSFETLLTSGMSAIFGRPTSYGPEFLISAPFQDSAKFSQRRATLTEGLDLWRTSLANVADPLKALTDAEVVVREAESLMSDIAQTVVGYQEDRASASEKASITTIQSTVTGILQKLSGAKTAYRGNTTSVGTAASAITQAQGMVQSAQAAYNATIVRAPFTGTVNALPVTVGTFISAGTEVAALSNKDLTEIRGYIRADDLAALKVGDSVRIDDTDEGTISAIAGSPDPVTKKAEIRVVPKVRDTYTSGQSVSLTLTRAQAVLNTTSTSTLVTVPVAMIKFLPEGPAVLTVNEKNELTALPVVLGAMLGDKVEVVSGITSGTHLVRDARGLKVGTAVTVTE